jgi:hypothetical protein
MVAVPSDIASAANINDKLFNSVKIERNQNLTNKGVSEKPTEESPGAEPNENSSPEVGGESSEDKDSEPEACPPRKGCPPNHFKTNGDCRKCP